MLQLDAAALSIPSNTVWIRRISADLASARRSALRSHASCREADSI